MVIHGLFPGGDANTYKPWDDPPSGLDQARHVSFYNVSAIFSRRRPEYTKPLLTLLIHPHNLQETHPKCVLGATWKIYVVHWPMVS